MPKIGILKLRGNQTYRVARADLEPDRPTVIRDRWSQQAHSLEGSPIFPQTEPFIFEDWTTLADARPRQPLPKRKRWNMVTEDDNFFPVTFKDGDPGPKVEQARQDEVERIYEMSIAISAAKKASKADSTDRYAGPTIAIAMGIACVLTLAVIVMGFSVLDLGSVAADLGQAAAPGGSQ